MPDDILFGEFMREIITNNTKNKLTFRRDIKAKLVQEKEDYPKILTQLNKKFQVMGFELAPCTANTLLESESFFLVRKADLKTEDTPSLFHEKLIIALTIIFFRK
ncbi:hypothetical protein TUBRATIS_11850 [Tubulinosema ratisbonensis]|uniref:Uncharacterized protein n=1 Tax=Tubulinosema ratisbonensis TaxID=291195 RepID=A0A437AMN7_9MICR|nr:hypothetical protein TUBRATIS_11850 [Tubulinosema ratisbonensis]